MKTVKYFSSVMFLSFTAGAISSSAIDAQGDKTLVDKINKGAEDFGDSVSDNSVSVNKILKYKEDEYKKANTGNTSGLAVGASKFINRSDKSKTKIQKNQLLFPVYIGIAIIFVSVIYKICCFKLEEILKRQILSDYNLELTTPSKNNLKLSNKRNERIKIEVKKRLEIIEENDESNNESDDELNNEHRVNEFDASKEGKKDNIEVCELNESKVEEKNSEVSGLKNKSETNLKDKLDIFFNELGRNNILALYKLKSLVGYQDKSKSTGFAKVIMSLTDDKVAKFAAFINRLNSDAISCISVAIDGKQRKQFPNNFAKIINKLGDVGLVNLSRLINDVGEVETITDDPTKLQLFYDKCRVSSIANIINLLEDSGVNNFSKIIDNLDVNGTNNFARILCCYSWSSNFYKLALFINEINDFGTKNFSKIINNLNDNGFKNFTKMILYLKKYSFLGFVKMINELDLKKRGNIKRFVDLINNIDSSKIKTFFKIIEKMYLNNFDSLLNVIRALGTKTDTINSFFEIIDFVGLDNLVIIISKLEGFMSTLKFAAIIRANASCVDKFANIIKKLSVATYGVNNFAGIINKLNKEKLANFAKVINKLDECGAASFIRVIKGLNNFGTANFAKLINELDKNGVLKFVQLINKSTVYKQDGDTFNFAQIINNKDSCKEVAEYINKLENNKLDGFKTEFLKLANVPV